MKRKEYKLLLPFGLSRLCFQSSTSLMLEKRKTFYISLLNNNELSAVTVWDLDWCKSMKLGTGAICFFITAHIICHSQQSAEDCLQFLANWLNNLSLPRLLTLTLTSFLLSHIIPGEFW